MLAATFALLASSSATSAAEGIFSEPWGAVRTEHFVLHYHRATKPMAGETAAMLEEAHVLVAERFGWEPTRRTHVVLEDPTDSPNGLASTVPWNDIRLNAVAPVAISSLGFYDNWMWNLVVHEYVHIVHISRVRGIPRLINLLTNGEMRPNQALPRWFIEGLATWFESDSSGTGRVGSALFDAYQNGAALDGTFPTLGSLSGSPLEFPYATGWYLYGSRFFEFVIDEHGFDAVADFIDAYALQIIPFRINVIARRTIGEGFVEMWPRFEAGAAGDAWAAHVIQRASHSPSPRMLTELGHRTEYLARHPDGGPAWIRNDGHSKTTLVVHDGAEVPLESVGEFDFLDERTAVIALSHATRVGYSFRDLFALDLVSGELTALTWGARATQPSVSPSRDRVAFSSMAGGRSELRILTLSDESLQTCVVPAGWGQASSPTWLDENRIVFSYLRPGQGRDLFVYDIRDESVVALTADGAAAVTPYAHEGLVYFSSDRTGRFDLYRLDPDLASEPERLTASATGYLSPVVATVDEVPQLFFAAAGGTGLDVASIPLDTAALTRGRAEPQQRRTPAAFESVTLTERYRVPARAMRPPDLTLAFGVSGETQALGFGLATRDVGANSIALSVEYAREFGQPVGGLEFTNRRLPVALTFSGSRGLVQRDDTLRAGSEFVPYVEERYQGLVGLSAPHRRIGSSHTFSVSYSANWYRFLDEPEVTHEPTDLEPLDPNFVRFNALRIGWAWRDRERDTHSFTTNRGSAAELSFRFRSPAIGAEVETAELSGSVSRYGRVGRASVLAARFSGGISEARGASRRVYAIGGLAPHDVFMALQESTPAGIFHVRGHIPSARSGNRFVRMHVEWRLPLVDIGAGAGTIPVFLERLHAAFFVDAGMAASRNLALADGIYGIGGELRLSSTLGYTESANFRAGIARGFGEGGIWDVYLLYGFEF